MISLDQLDELDRKATQGEWCGRLLFEANVHDSEFCDALVNWWRSEGKARLQSLEQELELARKDAERYRWLRSFAKVSRGYGIPGDIAYVTLSDAFIRWEPYEAQVSMDGIDAAIDSARRTSGDERG